MSTAYTYNGYQVLGFTISEYKALPEQQKRHLLREWALFIGYLPISRGIYQKILCFV